jgi:predicted acetyltransferase
MNNACLISPSINYKNSYLDALNEFRGVNDLFFSRRLIYEAYDMRELEGDFEKHILQPFSDFSNGIGMPDGFIPQSEYWLVQGNEYIGAIHIRHGLTEHLENEGGNLGYEIRPSRRRQGYAKIAVKLGLKKAAALGVPKVLITCNALNIPSARTAMSLALELNGVEADSFIMNDGRTIRKFWFDT